MKERMKKQLGWKNDSILSGSSFGAKVFKVDEEEEKKV